MKVTNKTIATLIDAMGMKSCNDERIENGLSAAYPDSTFTASAQDILNEGIDWEERKFEITKAAINAMLSNPAIVPQITAMEDIAILSKTAVVIANETVKAFASIKNREEVNNG